MWYAPVDEQSSIGEEMGPELLPGREKGSGLGASCSAVDFLLGEVGRSER